MRQRESRRLLDLAATLLLGAAALAPALLILWFVQR